ncbi:phage tail tip fiber protein [Morganella psychrotolerans]|uniref:phage tail tip fiber protein n=1 Tax=Morganella psychrotolerans TaxID=368603 RepID=UPI002958BE9C|nr:phage tail protein [Morganella psychrotolerans]
MDKQRKLIAGAGGGGGGGSPRTPVEAPDNVESKTLASILDLLGEGVIGGLKNGGQSVFLDDVPLLNPDGSSNFNGVKIWERRGEQNQDPIEGFDDIETPYNVAVELKTTTPKTIQIDNDDTDRVRIIMEFPRLSSTDKESGDINGAKVEFQFQLAIGDDSFKPVIPVNHKSDRVFVEKKSSGKFLREYFIDLPKPGKNYRIKIIRFTADSTSDFLANKTNVSSYGEIVFARLSYPNSALVGVTIDSREFGGNMPRRSYLVAGLKIQVPSNYRPSDNTYQGDWEGDFDYQVSSNPAWILYDILTNSRYGLGDFIDESMIDTGMLYQIGRYCDEEVSDGFGGKEKRFAINTVIANRQEAYKVINDIASVFRGMVFWAGGMVNMQQDSPADPVMMFSSANIIDRVTRKGSARKDRPTVAVITYNDKDDLYKQNIEYVEDEEGKAIYGIRKAESLAFGCTSRGQAYRTGLWMLYTSKMETDVILFKSGIDSAMLMPGDIVKLNDKYRSGKRNSGRIISYTKNSIKLDQPITLDKEGAFVSFMTADGRMIDRNVLEPAGTYSLVTFKDAIRTGDEPVEMGVWMVTEPDLEPELIRVLSIKASDEQGVFEITGVSHNPTKFEAIDNGATLVPAKTTVKDPTFSKPSGLSVLETTYLSSPGNLSVKLVVSWDGRSTRYVLRYRRSDVVDNWTVAELSDNQYEILNVADNARYDIEVFAISITGRKTAADSLVYNTLGTMTPPGAPTALTAVGDYRQIILSWVNPDSIDLETIYVYGSKTNSFEAAAVLAKIPSTTFTHSGLDDDETWYYWIRAVNKRGMLSPVNSNLGTVASTKDVLSFLKNKITQSELGKELLEEIQSKVSAEDLDALEDLLKETDDKIGGAVTDLASVKESQENLESAVKSTKENADNALKQAGEAANKVVELSESVEESGKAVTSSLKAIQTVVDDATTTITEEQKARIEGDKKTAEKVDLIETKVSGYDAAIKRAETAAVTAEKATAGVSQSIEAVAKAAIDVAMKGEEDVRTQDETNAKIFTDQRVIADGQQALSEEIKVLSADFDGNIKARLAEESRARATADEALANQVTQLRSEVGTDIKAQLDEEKKTRATADEAVSTSVERLKVQTGKDIEAAVLTERTARTKADESMATQIEALSAKTGENIAAAVTAETKARTEADSALATDISKVLAKTEKNEAAVKTEQSARTSADNALGSRIDSVQAKTGENSAAVQQSAKAIADLNGKITASWNVKIETTSDGKKYAAGFGVGIEGGTSQFLVQADRFGLINVVNGQVTTPFVVENGITYMNGAFIKDGTISGAKVGTLESVNYKPGQTGWRFDKNGKMEMNGQTAGAGRLSLTNERLDVYDEKGVLRVRLGLL